jgi:translation initiation factor IF-3
MVSLAPDEQSFPICKIQNKRNLREAEKARSKKKDSPSATVKTIELNWAIDAHDLKHRLERVKDFLVKGWRVDIIMAGKKRGRKATPEEAQSCLAAVREAIAEVEGAKEWKSMNGTVGGLVTVYAEGREQKLGVSFERANV